MTANLVSTLYVAFELGQDKWLLAFATQAAEKPRFRSVPARELGRAARGDRQGQGALRTAGRRRGLHLLRGRPRWLLAAPRLDAMGIDNVVVDSSSIEVNRRSKQVKTDPVDAAKLVNLLCRYHGGERKVWSVVNVPGVADEDRRQLHRGLKDLQRQQTECSNRIKGLLASQGLTAGWMPSSARRWRSCATGRISRCRRDCSSGSVQEFAVWEALHRQVRDAANEQERRLREGKEPYLEKVRRLMGLKAVGVRSAWILVMELFAGVGSGTARSWGRWWV